MFHIMANTLTTGGAVVLADVPAVTDPAFSIRNNHFIFSEQYGLLAVAALGPGITALQSNTPHWTYINPPVIRDVMLSATVPSNPQVFDLRDSPMPIPINEEVQWQVSDANSEQMKLFTWIGTPGWTRDFPKGSRQIGQLPMRQTILLTASIATVANAWSADATLTQATQLRGGTYAIIGMTVVAAASLAFRINFPRRPLVMGRKTYPGDLCVQAYQTIPNRFGPNWLGLYGYFNTFELPTIAAFANASATVTHTIYADVLYLSDQTSYLDTLINSAA